MTPLHFQHPYVLVLLVPIALLALLMARRGRPGAALHASTDLLRAVSRTRRTRFGRFLPVLQWLGAALVVVGLARPTTEQAHAKVEASGVDVMLAIDVSGSMQARDMATPDGDAVSRLDAAKAVVSRFVSDRGNDRIGLVGFAAEPYLASPLTLDHDWVQQGLERLDASGLRDGTAIGSAIASAVRRLDGEDAKTKIVVLLTDGQNNAGKIDPKAAAEAARALGVKIYTIAVGSAGEALVPVKGDDGTEHLVKARVDVDEKGLAEVAQATGGRFFRATDASSLADVYGAIDRLEKTTHTMSSFTDRTERFALFAAPGVVLVALALLLSATRFRRVP